MGAAVTGAAAARPARPQAAASGVPASRRSRPSRSMRRRMPRSRAVASSSRHSSSSGRRASNSRVRTVSAMPSTVRASRRSTGRSSARCGSAARRGSRISSPPWSTVRGVRSSWLTSPVKLLSRCTKLRKAVSRAATALASTPTSSSSSVQGTRGGCAAPSRSRASGGRPSTAAVSSRRGAVRRRLSTTARNTARASPASAQSRSAPVSFCLSAANTPTSPLRA